ncbi:MAG: prolipoprotein diacylglyceryl transferase [Proteobacteria bacterium]|nr:prolipoprotein diacylglyceryl transferase [Pseudomonadota bacterium]
MINYPNIDPVIFSVGGFSVRWYGVAYAIGFILAIYNAKKLCRIHLNTPIQERHIDALFSNAILGVIAGGRLGYVLFYNLPYFLENPMDVLKIWQGGMSFHGGFIGVMVAVMVYARKEKLSFLHLMDRVAPGACLGLMLGRIANFINGELWGKPTDVSWAMIFPDTDGFPRHPSQLYEAFFEGLVLFIILYAIARKTSRRGVIAAVFLVGYGVFRFLIEYTRQGDDIAFLHKEIFNYISMGQILSLPMIIGGIILFYRIYKDYKKTESFIKHSLETHHKEVEKDIKSRKKRK